MPRGHGDMPAKPELVPAVDGQPVVPDDDDVFIGDGDDDEDDVFVDEGKDDEEDNALHLPEVVMPANLPSASNLGGFGTPFRVPGPPVICRFDDPTVAVVAA